MKIAPVSEMPQTAPKVSPSIHNRTSKRGLKEGRPTKYTKELATLICERIAKGESVRSIERDKDMPNGTTIYSWLFDERLGEFYKHYTRARDTQAEVIFEEIIELSDLALQDIVGDDKSDNARVQARKLQIDARHWHLSKLRPKKYGDKLDLTSMGDKLPTPILALTGNRVVVHEQVQEAIDPPSNSLPSEPPKE